MQAQTARPKSPDVEVVEKSFEVSPPKKAVRSIRLVLRGPDGLTTTRSFARDTKISELLDIFLAEHAKTNQKRKAAIEFDGERLKPSSTIADLDDLDDEDALDVKLA